METLNRGEVLKKGEEIYLNTLKGPLEAGHMGEYVAIDVETGAHVLDAVKLQVVKKAQETFEQRRFYVVQVGNLEEPIINFLEPQNAAWLFSK